MVRTVRMALAALLVGGVLAVGAAPVGAEDPVIVEVPTRVIATGGWLADTTGPLGVTPSLTLRARVETLQNEGTFRSYPVEFRAAGQTICVASYNLLFDDASCTWVTGKPLGVLGMLLLQKVEAVFPGYDDVPIPEPLGDGTIYRYLPSSTVVPIIK